MSERMVMCRKLGRELPGMTRQPFKNELGKKLFEQVSQEAWNVWIRQESPRVINTYRVDLMSPQGQTFMQEQIARYFGFEDGEVAETAWTPPAK